MSDCAEILRRAGKCLAALPCFDVAEALGVNTPEQLAEVERVLHACSTVANAVKTPGLGAEITSVLPH